MGCTNCNNDPNCGCTQESLHISRVCNPIECPIDECSESFSAACSIYTGDDIVCENVVVVTTGTNVAQAIANIVAYFCTTTAPALPALACGNDIIMPAGEPLGKALEQLAAYFCNAIANIELTPGPQGIQGIQGIPGVGRKKFVKETIFPDADSLTTFILINEYSPCLVASDYCGVATPSITDIIVTGYWFDSINGYWVEFTHKDKSEIFIDTLGNVLVVGQLPAVTYPINARIIITN